MKKYKVLSLFSGAGGLDYGLEKTGRIDIVRHVERDKTACATLGYNLKKAPRIMCADITKLNFGDMFSESSRPDVLVGGPPCQSFSSAGKRTGIQDQRGKMIWEFMRAIVELLPTVFVMENVPGLAWSGNPKGCVLDDWLACVPVGYSVEKFIVNSADYGAPQARKRLVVVGVLSDNPPVFTQPTHGRKKPHRTLRNAIGKMPFSGLCAKFNEATAQTMRHVPEGGNWKDLPVATQKKVMGNSYNGSGGRVGYYRRLSFDKPSPSLLCSPTQRYTLLCHPTETRPLSVNEYARIQGFPASWRFYGTTAQQYKQIGNAVPVALGEAIGRTVVNILDRSVN